MCRAVGLFLVFGLFACATRGGSGTAQKSSIAARDAKSSWRDGTDELSIAMRALAPELEVAGVAPEGRGVRGFLTAGGRMTHPLHLPAETCATLVAISSRGVHDMDAALYSPEGELLAADAQPDASPTIQLCTGKRAEDFYYALHVYEGAGSFLMLPFVGDKQTLSSVNDRLGDRPAIARLDDRGDDPVDRLAIFDDGVQRRGFVPVTEPIRVPLSADQRVRVALLVRAGECYTAAGFAIGRDADLNLRVLDDEGSEVARDESPAGDAAVQFCPDHSGQFAAELHGAHGDGGALLSTFGANAAELGGPEALWLGERPVERPSELPLPEALARASQRAAEDGFRRRRALGTRRLLPGQAVREGVLLPARRCTRIHAVGGPGLRSLRLSAVDGEGKQLGKAAGTAHSTYLHVCSPSSRDVRLSLHAAAGGGEVALMAFDAPLSRAKVAGADADVSAAFYQATAQARDAGYHPHPSFARGPQRLRIAGSSIAPVSLGTPAAHCVRAYVLSQDPEVQAKLMLDGKPQAAARANAAPAYACADGDAPVGEVGLAVERAGQEGDPPEAWVMVLIK